MTDDLVRRLRYQQEWGSAGEAADRIEELETKLREAEGTIWSLIETVNSLSAAPRQKKAKRATMQKECR